MSETAPENTAQVYNASWSGQPTMPPQPPASDEPHVEGSHRRILKVAAILFGLITLFFIILVFIIPIFTTGGSSGEKSGGGNGQLTYWGVNEDKSVMDGVISDFEKENPNIKVDYVKQDSSDYRERLSTRIGNGTGPDIFSYHNSWYPMLSGFLAPLSSDVLEPKDVQSDYYPVASEDLVKNGRVYGLPLEIDTLSLFVNRQIFSDAGMSPPKTWQEFIDDATKLTKRDDNGKISVAGAAVGTYDNVDHAADIVSLLFAQNGVDLQNIQKNSSKVADALQFYKNFSLVENSVWDGTLDKSLMAFSGGKVAMVFGYAKDYASLKSQNPGLSVQIVPVPQLLDSDKKDIASYWVQGVSAKSKNNKEAQVFLAYLARPDVEQKIYQEETKRKGAGRPFALKSLAAKVSADYKVFLDQAGFALSSPFVDGTFDNGLNEGLDGLIKDAISSDLSQQDMDKLFQGYSQVLGQY